MTTRTTLPVLALALFALPACGGAPASGAVSEDDEALTHTSRSITTLLDAIKAAEDQEQGQPPVVGTRLHACHTRGVRPKVSFDVYVEKDVIEDAPGTIVIQSDSVRFVVETKVNLGKYGGAYQNDDAPFELEGVSFLVDVNDPEGYAYFTGAFFDQPDLVCSAAPPGWGP